MMWLKALSLFFIVWAQSHALEIDPFYADIFPGYDKLQEAIIEDPISENPINTKLLVVYKGSEVQGYIRELTTTTGCNSACLPLIYTTFYHPDGSFKKLKSRDGLTKKNHRLMTQEDYSRLEMLVMLAPEQFDKVTHPKEMTDAISGETIKDYQDIVVKEAAYSTLRVHVYNQHTMKEIKRLKSTKQIP